MPYSATMHFADYLLARIETKGSILIAGIDPRLEHFPQFVLRDAESRHGASADSIKYALSRLYLDALDLVEPSIAAVKINSAFFEQYGLAGLHAFSEIIAKARHLKIPVIGDVKRSDIGSTAQAYARAYLNPLKVFTTEVNDFEVDAITINPFLGSDTIEPFIEAAQERKKGLFLLVRTSNPGSAEFQGQVIPRTGTTISDAVAHFVARRGESLLGSRGYSLLGAVVGAVEPGIAEALRTKMPHAIFLIPGFGAQGGLPEDAVAGIAADGRGGIVNASRGLFEDICTAEERVTITSQEWGERLARNALDLKNRLNMALLAKTAISS